ncbi:MAG: right-handed parallel beta-helix repeat-containing protein, partial [Lachnospiraceae bacterium]|nr:right-handed parallel beta-helix repeat-containing protein [Lachnospiraceae bacterium]
KSQKLIDIAFAEGGVVILVPEGTFLTGALYFKQGVNLYIEKDGVLKGSDDVSDYPVCKTRIEGETCMYLPALINGHGLKHFVMCGQGTIDGNGLKAWKAFWQRREWNPKCTNKDEQRPRLVYLSDCSDVIIGNLHLQNSQFWTIHIYKCDHIKLINCKIYSPTEPVKAPSTDAIDIDVCSDVLVKNCYMQVNDDAVVLKGGKGPWADSDPDNGTNQRILIEDCEYGFCHGCLICGSESVHNRNLLMRRINVTESMNLLWLKLRPDTPQLYEYITVEDIKGKMMYFININPWKQFFDLKDREHIPLSYAEHITMRNCKCECYRFFFVNSDREQYELKDFVFEQLSINAKMDGYRDGVIDGVEMKDVEIVRASNEI